MDASSDSVKWLPPICLRIRIILSNGEDQVEQSRIFGAADFPPPTMAAKEQTESSSQPYLITHMLKCSDSSDTLLLFFGASATFMCFYANFWHFTIAVMPIMVLKMMLICWCWCWFWCWRFWCWWCWCWSPDGQVTECSLGREVHFANTRMPLVTHILSQKYSINTKRTRQRYCPKFL